MLLLACLGLQVNGRGGAWQKEAASPYPGRMRFFSRAFTDLLSNKRSFAVGLRDKGCIPEIMTSTFTDFDEWAAAVCVAHSNS